MMENTLVGKKNVLICIDEQVTLYKNLDYIKENFYGTVLTKVDELKSYDFKPETICYILGSVGAVYDYIQNKDNKIICAVRELSHDHLDSFNYVDVGELPMNIHDIGIFFRKFYNPEINYFDLIKSEHKFQALTESNKQTDAFRKGIYLTDVTNGEQGIEYNLLRCSTNLKGPTDCFRTTDRNIIDKLNCIIKYFYKEKVCLNHVLAQIYENSTTAGANGSMQKKAKISQHSDKTKDMPRNALMAFCTFYKGLNDGSLKNVKRSADCMYDYVYNKTSVLTKLRFRLKGMITDPKYVKEFEITLYPGSVFIMSLETNRLYTHEIVPSVLPVDKIPTRLGYVVRCSDTKALFTDKAYVQTTDGMVCLRNPTEEDIAKLKSNYRDENSSDRVIDYGNVDFSLNDGDYMKPYI